MGRRLNVLIVPEGGGEPKRFTPSILMLKTAAWLAGIILLVIIAGAVSWSGLARRALDYDLLKSENDRLDMENRRILRVAKEVDQSRQILAQIIRSLGGHLELGRPAEIDSLASLDENFLSGGVSADAEDLLGSESYAVERIMAYGIPTLNPVEGFVSRGFSEDFLFPERSHRGIDIAGKTGTPVSAATAGRVVFDGWTPYFGKCLIIAHPQGYMTFYGHNLVNLKTVQEKVKRGEPIALLGNSGRSSAPHLHFEIWKDGIPVDPVEFLQVPGI